VARDRTPSAVADRVIELPMWVVACALALVLLLPVALMRT